MLLAFKLSDIVTVPFGYLIAWLYQITANYGVALILFTILVKIILLPVSAKGKKSMMKMSRLTPLVQKIQKKYSDDQMKQNQAVQELYRQEGVSMGGGCLWSFIPLLILLPLYTVVRQPIVYMLRETLETAEKIVATMQTAAPELFGRNSFYAQMTAASNLPKFAEAVKAAIPTISANTLQGVNFNFLGIDLGSVPQFNIFAWQVADWAHIGGFLLPVVSAGTQVLSTLIMNKQNSSVVTDENGVQDADAAKASQQSTQTMMYMMPLMTLYFGFTMPGALSLYWIAQSIVSIAQDVILTRHYRKIYDAEDAVRLQRMIELDRIEEEKERIRAERRAANPDGITENTSKKKVQKQLQQAKEAERAAAAKEYAARRGEVVEEEEVTEDCPSGIPERPYCKGRNYNPNRYRRQDTEE